MFRALIVSSFVVYMSNLITDYKMSVYESIIIFLLLTTIYQISDLKFIKKGDNNGDIN